MITLFQFPSCWNLPNVSPFCMKVETYLRLAKLPFKIKLVSNPSRGPKGKLPFIKDDDVIVADSTFIVNYLKNKYGDALDRSLSELQQAQAISIQRMLEEHLYWVIVYSRWIDPNGWKIVKNDFFEFLPSFPKLFVPTLVQHRIKKAIYFQGIGRHSPEEIYDLGKRDVLSLAIQLGTKNFIFGDKPTSLDACIYAFIANILLSPVPTSLKTFSLEIPELSAYYTRMTKYAYQDTTAVMD